MTRKFEVHYKRQLVDTIDAEDEDEAIDTVVRNLDDWDAFDVTDADEQQDLLNKNLEDMNDNQKEAGEDEL